MIEILNNKNNLQSTIRCKLIKKETIKYHGIQSHKFKKASVHKRVFVSFSS